MMRVRLLFALMVLGGRLAAAPSTAIVPVVGAAIGAGMARWQTDVELYNGTAFPTDVAIELSAHPDSFLSLTLSPGERKVFQDIVGLAFGQENVLSPLRVTSERPIFVRAWAFAVQDGKVSSVQTIDVYYRPAFFPVRVLDGLAFGEAYRTNIGLANFSESEAHFVVALERTPGRVDSVTALTLGPGMLAHASIQSLFPTIGEGSGFSVVVESASEDTYVYASVIESATSSARFVTPRIGTR